MEFCDSIISPSEAEIRKKVHDLYRSCHQEAPLVVVAHDDERYDELANLLPGRDGVSIVFLVYAVGLFVLMMSALAKGMEAITALGVVIALGVILMTMVAFLAGEYVDHEMRMAVRIARRRRLPELAGASRAETGKAFGPTSQSVQEAMLSAVIAQSSGDVVDALKERLAKAAQVFVNASGRSLHFGLLETGTEDGVAEWMPAFLQLLRTRDRDVLGSILLDQAVDLDGQVDRMLMLDGAVLVLLGSGDRPSADRVSGERLRPAESDAVSNRALRMCVQRLRTGQHSRLARECLTWPAEDMGHALALIGHEKAACLLGAEPLQWDASGALYRFGHRSRLYFVRVEDAVRGADGEQLVHWMAVPPHIATAREGVAWTFGLEEPHYRPTAET